METEKSDEKRILDKMKLANYRLRELEKNDMKKSSNAYRYLDELSTVGQKRSNSLKGVIRYDSENRPRFSESKNNYDMRDNWKEAEIEVDRFLNALTSTVVGTKNKYEKAYEKYKENHDSNISFEKYSQYFQQFEGNRTLLKELQSDVIVLGLNNMDQKEINDLSNQYENANSEREEIEAINNFIDKANEFSENQSLFSKMKKKIGDWNFRRKSATQRKKALKELEKKKKKKKKGGVGSVIERRHHNHKTTGKDITDTFSESKFFGKFKKKGKRK